MTNVYWKGPKGTQTKPLSGRYETGAYWSTGSVPGQSDDVYLLASRYSVTRGTATSAVQSLTVGAGATFVTTTDLQVLRNTEIDGTLNMAGSFSSDFLYGSGTVAGYGTVSSFIGGPRTGPGIVPTPLSFRAIGGTLEIDASSPFQSQFGGLLSGAGTIDFHSGAVVFNAGTKATVANLTFSGAQIWLKQDFRYSGTFSLTGGTFSLVDGLTEAHGNVSLAGPTTLGAADISGFGTDSAHASMVYLRGSSTIAGTTVHGATIENLGHVDALGNLMLGSANGGDGRLFNARTAVYEFGGDSGIGVVSGGSGTVINQGSIVKTGGSGSSSFDVAVRNDGGIQVSSGQFWFNQDVTGKGAFAIDNDTLLDFGHGVSKDQTIIFGDQGNGTLRLTDSADFHGKISGMNAGDKIDLIGFPSTHDGFTYQPNVDNSGGTLTLTSAANQHATFVFIGQFEASGFHTGPDAYNGTFLTYTPPEFNQVHAAASLLSAPHA